MHTVLSTSLPLSTLFSLLYLDSPYLHFKIHSVSRKFYRNFQSRLCLNSLQLTLVSIATSAQLHYFHYHILFKDPFQMSEFITHLLDKDCVLHVTLYLGFSIQHTFHTCLWNCQWLSVLILKIVKTTTDECTNLICSYAF